MGHVDRSSGYSFRWPGAGPQREVFRSSLARLLHDHPIGSAMELFNERYAGINTSLTAELEDVKFGKTVDEQEMASLWTSTNDARNYVILGDPAVRLRTKTL